MTRSDYDLVVVGGGICGASLAQVMAGAGTGVLVLERDPQFRDRVRGEFVEPWGVAETRALGLSAALVSAGAHELPLLVTGSDRKGPRDLTRTSAPKCPALTFYHPAAQDALLHAATRAGAEVWRGAQVHKVQPGAPTRVVVSHHERTVEVTGRLVVGADGRHSLARKSLGRPEQIHDEGRLLAGVLLGEVCFPEDRALIAMSPPTGHIAYLFPQGGKRARAYVGFRSDARDALRGGGDLGRFIEASVATGAPSEAYGAVSVEGPLATFDTKERWVDHPYQDGVVLIGDAAGVSDPTWGQGLSLGFRDVRVLRDCLLADEDWEAAGHAYAEAHDRSFRITQTVVGWLTDFFLASGSEAEARRARPLAREDPSRVPYHLVSGPDLPADERGRRRFFGEE